jgi:hypothetical protein
MDQSERETRARVPSCAECRAGEIYDSAAVALVLITDDVREERPRPCRKWVCQEHLDMLHDDGSVFTIERRLANCRL